MPETRSVGIQREDFLQMPRIHHVETCAAILAAFGARFDRNQPTPSDVMPPVAIETSKTAREIKSNTRLVASD